MGIGGINMKRSNITKKVVILLVAISVLFTVFGTFPSYAGAATILPSDTFTVGILNKGTYGYLGGISKNSSKSLSARVYNFSTGKIADDRNITYKWTAVAQDASYNGRLIFNFTNPNSRNTTLKIVDASNIGTNAKIIVTVKAYNSGGLIGSDSGYFGVSKFTDSYDKTPKTIAVQVNNIAYAKNMVVNVGYKGDILIDARVLNGSYKDMSSNYDYRVEITNNPKGLDLDPRDTKTYDAKFRVYSANVQDAPLTLKIYAVSKVDPYLSKTSYAYIKVNVSGDADTKRSIPSKISKWFKKVF